MIEVRYVNKGPEGDLIGSTLVVNPSGSDAFLQVSDNASDLSFIINFTSNNISIGPGLGTYSNNYITSIIGCIRK